jgi:hypothetical protein
MRMGSARTRIAEFQGLTTTAKRWPMLSSHWGLLGRRHKFLVDSSFVGGSDAEALPRSATIPMIAAFLNVSRPID